MKKLKSLEELDSEGERKLDVRAAQGADVGSLTSSPAGKKGEQRPSAFTTYYPSQPKSNGR